MPFSNRPVFNIFFMHGSSCLVKSSKSSSLLGKSNQRKQNEVVSHSAMSTRRLKFGRAKYVSKCLSLHISAFALLCCYNKSSLTLSSYRKVFVTSTSGFAIGFYFYFSFSLQIYLHSLDNLDFAENFIILSLDRSAKFLNML